MIRSIHADAYEDLREGAAFYRKRSNSALARRFLNEFDRTVAFLLEFPGAGAPIDTWRHSFPFRTFPYSVIYFCEGEALRILAVHSQNREPHYWQRRR